MTACEALLESAEWAMFGIIVGIALAIGSAVILMWWSNREGRGKVDESARTS